MTIDAPNSNQQLVSGRNIQPGRSGAKAVKIHILGKEIQVGCSAGDESDLEKAAKYVDASMRESRNRNKTLPVEKIAIVTAINLANELIKTELNTEKHNKLSNGNQDSNYHKDLNEKLQALNRKIDDIISPDETREAVTDKALSDTLSDTD